MQHCTHKVLERRHRHSVTHAYFMEQWVIVWFKVLNSMVLVIEIAVNHLLLLSTSRKVKVLKCIYLLRMLIESQQHKRVSRPSLETDKFFGLWGQGISSDVLDTRARLHLQRIKSCPVQSVPLSTWSKEHWDIIWLKYI